MTGALRPFLRALLFLSALALGGIIGGVSEGLARLALHPHPRNLSEPVEGIGEGLEWIVESFLSSGAPLVLAGLVVFLWSDRRLAVWWLAVACLQAAYYLGSNCRDEPLAWLPALLACGMLATALWFATAWWRNRWAREMAVLHAEAAAAIAEQERRQDP